MRHVGLGRLVLDRIVVVVVVVVVVVDAQAQRVLHTIESLPNDARLAARHVARRRRRLCLRQQPQPQQQQHQQGHFGQQELIDQLVVVVVVVVVLVIVLVAIHIVVVVLVRLVARDKSIRARQKPTAVAHLTESVVRHRRHQHIVAEHHDKQQQQQVLVGFVLVVHSHAHRLSTGAIQPAAFTPPPTPTSTPAAT